MSSIPIVPTTPPIPSHRLTVTMLKLMSTVATIVPYPVVVVPLLMVAPLLLVTMKSLVVGFRRRFMDLVVMEGSLASVRSLRVTVVRNLVNRSFMSHHLGGHRATVVRNLVNRSLRSHRRHHLGDRVTVVRSMVSLRERSHRGGNRVTDGLAMRKVRRSMRSLVIREMMTRRKRGIESRGVEGAAVMMMKRRSLNMGLVMMSAPSMVLAMTVTVARNMEGMMTLMMTMMRGRRSIVISTTIAAMTMTTSKQYCIPAFRMELY